MTLNRYVYSAVRIVPYPASGEFVNIAVIAGSDETGEWLLKAISNESRVRQFCGPEALAAAHDALSQIGFLLDFQAWITNEQSEEDEREKFVISEEVSEKWLTRLFEQNQRVVQFSSPAPVLATSVESAMELVFPRVTVQPERRTSARLTKWRLLSDLNRNFLSAGFGPGDFLRNTVLTASGQKMFTHPLDFLIVDVDAVELIQSWSFQVASQVALARDVKAWGWTLKELQEHGGSVSVETRSIRIPREIPICVVIAPPVDDQPSSIFDEALGVFEELGAEIKRHGEESTVAAKASELLAKRRGGFSLNE